MGGACFRPVDDHPGQRSFNSQALIFKTDFLETRSLDNTLTVITLNILAMHLITDEFPGYEKRYNPEFPESLTETRFQGFKLFIKTLYGEGSKGKARPKVDIINFQEIGPQDKIWLVKVFQLMNTLNPEEDIYDLVIGEEPTGKQNLRVATIYRSSRLNLVRTQPLVVQKSSGKFSQFGLQLAFNYTKADGSTKQINLVNVHFHSDPQIRAMQFSMIKTNTTESQHSKDTQVHHQKVNYSENLIIAGDFNEDVALTLESIKKALNLNLASVHTDLTLYPTENRFHKHVKTDITGTLEVFQRTQDGILFTGGGSLEVLETLSKTLFFETLIKQDMLNSIKERIANNVSEVLIMKELKNRGGEVGFPSKKWFSDHLPVGVIFNVA